MSIPLIFLGQWRRAEDPARVGGQHMTLSWVPLQNTRSSTATQSHTRKNSITSPWWMGATSWIYLGGNVEIPIYPIKYHHDTANKESRSAVFPGRNDYEERWNYLHAFLIANSSEFCLTKWILCRLLRFMQQLMMGKAQAIYYFVVNYCDSHMKHDREHEGLASVQSFEMLLA